MSPPGVKVRAGAEGAHARVPLNVRFKCATVERFIERFASTVGKDGIFLRSPSPMPLGTPLRFVIQLEDGTPLLKGYGTVVWNRKAVATRTGLPPGMGVRFDSLTPDSQPVLQQILLAKTAQVRTEMERLRRPSGQFPALPAEPRRPSRPRPAVGGAPASGGEDFEPTRVPGPYAHEETTQVGDAHDELTTERSPWGGELETRVSPESEELSKGMGRADPAALDRLMSGPAGDGIVDHGPAAPVAVPPSAGGVAQAGGFARDGAVAQEGGAAPATDEDDGEHQELGAGDMLPAADDEFADLIASAQSVLPSLVAGPRPSGKFRALQIRERLPWPTSKSVNARVGFLASFYLHVLAALALILSTPALARHHAHRLVEISVRSKPKPPPPEPPKAVEAPPPTPAPLVRPRPRRAPLTIPAVAPPPRPTATPPPPNPAPPPVFGLSMESTVQGGGASVAVPIGGTAMADPSQRGNRKPGEGVPGGTGEGPAAPVVQVTPPELSRGYDAPYPQKARQEGIEGKVLLLLTIDEKGHVVEARVLRGVGHGLDEAAREASLRFVFKPGTRAGRATRMEVRYTYTFVLDD